MVALLYGLELRTNAHICCECFTCIPTFAIWWHRRGGNIFGLRFRQAIFANRQFVANVIIFAILGWLQINVAHEESYNTCVWAARNVAHSLEECCICVRRDGRRSCYRAFAEHLRAPAISRARIEGKKTQTRRPAPHSGLGRRVASVFGGGKKFSLNR